MGNNQAYATFQRTVIALYNRGKLDLETLDELAEEYRGTDIDSGGDTGLLSRDGKDLETICIELVDPSYVATPPTDDDWEDPRYDKWREITDDRWGWE